jgi:hypothetical protein
MKLSLSNFYARLFFLSGVSGVLTNCVNTNAEFHEEKSCFCDSIYYNKNESTDKEILCYKDYDVFKLKIQKDSETLSRHKLSNPDYLYERLVVKNGIYNDSASYCLHLESKDNIVTAKFIGPDIDSLSFIMGAINGKNEQSYSMVGNKIDIKSSLFSDSIREVLFIGYETREIELPENRQREKVITLHKIAYSSMEALYKNSLDSVWFNFKKCVGK